jgi:hypothetical protein
MPERTVDVLIERPKPSEPVEIDLFGDGKKRILRYSIASIKRLKQRLGRPMMGLRGNIMELDEELLPTLLLEGLRHDPPALGQVCDCGFHAPNGIDPDVTAEMIDAVGSQAYPYLLQRFCMAWIGSRPEPLPALLLSPATPAPASKPN